MCSSDLEATRAAVAAAGLVLAAERPSNAVTAVRSPDGVDAGVIVRALRERHGMVIANGQDKLKGITFRLGHMGAYDAPDILGLVEALEDALAVAGHAVEPGAALAAAARVFAESRPAVVPVAVAEPR